MNTQPHALFAAIEAVFKDQIVPSLEKQKVPYDKRFYLGTEPCPVPGWSSYLRFLGIVYVMKTQGEEVDYYLFFDVDMRLLISSDNGE